ncbi:putative conserved hypothetical protein [Colletotrichum sublineola]|uniref:Ras modification protein ERF4 n=1 Tax=Colletotrichum sublineola TaxID=1173701 RepID=A0A066XQV4_COLSU|nr:putative conserved hypothetical protein [Colletotrichum sublineola]
MLGLSSNPISTIPPLNTIPTLHSPFACIWTLIWTQFFPSLSSITNCTRACATRACACRSRSDTNTDTTTCRSRTATLPFPRPPPVEAGIAFRLNSRTNTAAVVAATAIVILINKTAANHPLRPFQPLRLTSGRIAAACIENTNAVQAKAKGAARATVVAASAASCWSCTCTILHSFVRVPTRRATNLIALLRDPTLALRRYPFSKYTRSSSLSLSSSSLYFLPQRPTQSPLSLLSPSPSPPLSFKEALATSKSLAQALLLTPPRRQDPFSTVPPKAVVQPAYPGTSPDLTSAGLPQSHSPSLPHRYDPKEYLLQSPFRNRAASSAARRLPHLSAARLWNPTNSTPRLPDKPLRKRRPSTPPPPSIPLSHPTLGPSSLDPADPLGISAGDYPLLTLPEQRQTRHSTSARASLQVGRTGNSEHRISLPPSLRPSYDGRRSADPSPTVPEFDAGPADDKEGPSPLVRDFAIPLDTDKGKKKVVMEQRTESQTRGASKDLERGPDVLPRYSNASAGDGMGIGSAISSSNSSIMGEELPADMGEEWGPQHPCFPHLNPHVPLDSPEYRNTRIIRVRRDWLVEGDLAPTFSNLYPEILDPAGLSEQEFRRIIDKLNGELIPIFSPYSWRNIVDGVLGLLTGWLWDDLGFTGVKARLDRLERWIDQWNTEMEKTVGNEDGSMAPRIISLRKTGYMTLDIQIPDPEIAPAPSTPGGSRTEGLPTEPPPVAVA